MPPEVARDYSYCAIRHRTFWLPSLQPVTNPIIIFNHLSVASTLYRSIPNSLNLDLCHSSPSPALIEPDRGRTRHIRYLDCLHSTLFERGSHHYGEHQHTTSDASAVTRLGENRCFPASRRDWPWQLCYGLQSNPYRKTLCAFRYTLGRTDRNIELPKCPDNRCH